MRKHDWGILVDNLVKRDMVACLAQVIALMKRDVNCTTIIFGAALLPLGIGLLIVFVI